MESGLVIRLGFHTPILIVAMTCGVRGAHAQGVAQSRAWIAIGGASTTLQGACGEGCDLESPYFNTGSVLANVGYRVHRRMDTGLEIFWIPSHSAGAEKIHSTFLIGVAQFRPWEGRGFSVKGGMGMAFIRNWVYGPTGANPPFTSKALGLTYGAGWTFRRNQRLGVQIFAAHHVATLGDFETGQMKADNVIANFWSLGGTLVIR